MCERNLFGLELNLAHRGVKILVGDGPVGNKERGLRRIWLISGQSRRLTGPVISRCPRRFCAPATPRLCACRAASSASICLRLGATRGLLPRIPKIGFLIRSDFGQMLRRFLGSRGEFAQ